MRIAFASRDCEHVAELRLTPHLVVFDVARGGAELHRVYAFPPGKRMSTEERIWTVVDADVVYVSVIGPSLAARLAARGICPVTAPAGARIEDVVAALARDLAASERRRGAVVEEHVR